MVFGINTLDVYARQFPSFEKVGPAYGMHGKPCVCGAAPILRERRIWTVDKGAAI